METKSSHHITYIRLYFGCECVSPVLSVDSEPGRKLSNSRGRNQLLSLSNLYPYYLRWGIATDYHQERHDGLVRVTDGLAILDSSKGVLFSSSPRCSRPSSSMKRPNLSSTAASSSLIYFSAGAFLIKALVLDTEARTASFSCSFSLEEARAVPFRPTIRKRKELATNGIDEKVGQFLIHSQVERRHSSKLIESELQRLLLFPFLVERGIPRWLSFPLL